MELLCKFVDRGVIIIWLAMIFEWISIKSVYYSTSILFMYLGLLVVFYAIINYLKETKL